MFRYLGKRADEETYTVSVRRKICAHIFHLRIYATEFDWCIKGPTLNVISIMFALVNNPCFLREVEITRRITETSERTRATDMSETFLRRNIIF
jgi:hypothetical protein